MSIQNISKADYEEYLRLKNLRTAFPSDKAAIANLYRKAINPNFSVCLTCGAAVSEMCRRLIDWFESNHDAVMKQIQEPEKGLKDFKEWYQFIQKELKIEHFSRTNFKNWDDITPEQMATIDEIISHTIPTMEKNLKLSAVIKPIEKKLQDKIIECGGTIDE